MKKKHVSSGEGKFGVVATFTDGSTSTEWFENKDQRDRTLRKWRNQLSSDITVKEKNRR